MVNTKKLKGKMVELDVSICSLAEQLEISEATLYRRLLDNGESFTIKEVDLIVKALNLKCEDANAIFFSQLVA